MSIPEFMTNENVKPKDSYEWTIWGLINILVIVSFLVVIVPMVLIAFVMVVVEAAFGGGEE